MTRCRPKHKRHLYELYGAIAKNAGNSMGDARPGHRYDHMYSHETKKAVSMDVQVRLPRKKIPHTHQHRQIETVRKVFHRPGTERTVNHQGPPIRIIENVPAQMSILQSKSAQSFLESWLVTPTLSVNPTDVFR